MVNVASVSVIVTAWSSALARGARTATARTAVGRGRGRLRQLLGQELGQQEMTGSVEHGLLDDALQLTDVARPVVALEALQRLGSEATQIQAQLTVEAEQEVVGQLGDVLGPI